MRVYPTTYNGTDYYIDKTGNVYDFESKEIINKKFNTKTLAKIMTTTFCGVINLDIDHRDGDILNIERSNLYYKIPKKFNENLELYGFKQIKNYSRYYITKSGVIYSTIKNKILHHKIKVGGYHLISLYNDDGVRDTIFIHRLLYYNWVSDISIINNYHINHYDGRPWNNELVNLEETTPVENIQHAMNIIKTRPKAWDELEIREICEMLEKGVSARDIYQIIKTSKNISLNSIKELCHHLVYGTKFWIHVSKDYDFSKYIKNRYIHSDDKIHNVCKLLEDGIPVLDIGDITGVPAKYIYDIRKRIVRKNISSEYTF